MLFILHLKIIPVSVKRTFDACLVTKCFGQGRNLKIDTNSVKVEPYDQILLYSDGISKVINTEEGLDIINQFDDPKNRAATLAQNTRDRGPVMISQCYVPRSRMTKNKMWRLTKMSCRRNFLYISYLIFTVIISNSCATTVKTSILKPAEINLRNIDNITIGDISGNVGSSLADLLTTRLFESNKFTVVDRQNLQQIMKEYQLSAIGAVKTDKTADVGRLIGAAALITGNANLKYKLNYFQDEAWKDKKGKWHQYYYIEGTGRITSTLKVISLTSGEILAIKTITEEGNRTNRENNKWPARPCKDEIISEITSKTIDRFMKMITPYTEYVYVHFEHSEKPESKSGISLASQGMWSDALEQFKKAAHKKPTNPSDWYNLGLAYKYNFMFIKAIDAIEEAIKIDPTTKYSEEIVDVKNLQPERERLVQQGVVSPNN